MMEADKRGPGRPPLRENLRSADDDAPRPLSPKDAAAQRAEEILSSIRGEDLEGSDKFNAPKPPEGWTYEWKRWTILNEEDPAYQVSLAQTGWAPVPLSRHKEMMPRGFKGDTITREGMILMERPEQITDIFRHKDRKTARDQVVQKEAQLRGGALGRDGNMHLEGASSQAKLSRSYEPMVIPQD